MRHNVQGDNLIHAASRTNLNAALRPGQNVITAAVGNQSATYANLWFDLELFIEMLDGTDPNPVTVSGNLLLAQQSPLFDGESDSDLLDENAAVLTFTNYKTGFEETVSVRYYHGRFEDVLLPFGTYTLTITKPGYLNKTITNIVIDEANFNIPNIPLIPGNATRNGQFINVLDAMRVLSAFLGDASDLTIDMANINQSALVNGRLSLTAGITNMALARNNIGERAVVIDFSELF